MTVPIKLRQYTPNNLIAEGCAYIISRLIAPGKVQNLGGIQKIVFGIQDTQHEQLDTLKTIFQEAGIEAILTQDISPRIWEKFVFIATTATITSAYDTNFGGIKQSQAYQEALQGLIEECILVAKTKDIDLPSDIKERVWNLFLAVSPNATTSMHSDYLAGKNKTEVESLTGYIVEEARRYGLQIPQFQAMYAHLA